MIPALIGAAAGIGGTLLANSLNKSSTEQARDYDRKMWYEQAEYNSPKNQVKRLRAAGINPALALQNGSIESGNQSSPATQQHVPTYDFSPASQAVVQSAELYQNRRLQDAQIDNMGANTENVMIRNKTQLLRDMSEYLEKMSHSNKGSAEYQYYKWMAETARKDYETYDDRWSVERGLKASQAREHEAHADYLVAQKDFQDIINRFKPDEQQKILRNLDAQHDAIMAAANKDNEEAALAAANKALTDAKKDGVDIDNDVAESIMQARVDMAFSQSDESYWKSQNESKDYHRGKYASGFTSGGTYNFPDLSKGELKGSISYPSRSSHQIIRRRSRRQKYFRPE